MAEERNGNPLAEDQNSPSGNNNQNSNIPDWMREAGWEDDTGSFDESTPVFDDLEGEDDIVPAEIPSWLEEAAPERFNLDSDTSPANDGSDKKENEAQADPPSFESKAGDNKSDPIEEPALDVPSWLENLELDEDSQETAVAWLENMPESLRASDEELEQARINELKKIEVPEDDPAWTNEISKPESEPETQAELSEDLVSADLLPEQQSEDKLYATEELRSSNNDESPDWLNELGDESKTPQTPVDEPTGQEVQLIDEQIESEPSSQGETGEEVNLLPDWLSELGDEEESPEPGVISPPDSEDEPTISEDIPDWQGDFETPSSPVEPEDDSSSLDWLESLAAKQGVPEEQLISTPEEREQASPPSEEPDQTEATSPSEEPVQTEAPPLDQTVSPTDDTLNTEVPEWLSIIGENEDTQKVSEPESVPDESKFDESATWLEQLEEQPTGELQQEDPAHASEVMGWLEGMDDPSEEDLSNDPSEEDLSDDPSKEDLAEDLRESLTAELEEPLTKSMPTSDESENMPDWLSELDSPEGEDSSLESALRHSKSQLSAEEKDFLAQSEETQEENADWLAKLDLVDDQQLSDSDLLAIRIDMPEDKADQPDEEPSEEVSFTGGILDRLKDTGTIKIEPEIPQWLENLKKEEDPQETAILWLKQFVEQGDQADLTDQIKRYTDELNPGDTVPTWMEDLKNEEDPQTTAMLWLEKLSGERPSPEKPDPVKTQPDRSDWITALEKEEAEQSQVKPEGPAEDFHDDSNGWLEDLDIDEKIKTEEEELPDWMEDPDDKPEDNQQGDTPLWMKATSPLEGDFQTDELAEDEKKVEIPDWLAGYGEGEAPEEQTEGTEPAAAGDPDEYTWVPASDDTSKPAKEPIDLNSAAISQLEGILGISYQVARGIIRYREQHGPYQDLNDLLNVPEITDEQTIEILKPEVVIHSVKTKPKQVIAKKPQAKQDPGERLVKARSLMAERNIADSLAEYEYLIKKKKSLAEVIDDLGKAANDFPSDISIIKTLGDAYMKINNLEAALESYSKAEDLLS